MAWNNVSAFSQKSYSQQPSNLLGILHLVWKRILAWVTLPGNHSSKCQLLAKHTINSHYNKKIIWSNIPSIDRNRMSLGASNRRMKTDWKTQMITRDHSWWPKQNVHRWRNIMIKTNTTIVVALLMVVPSKVKRIEAVMSNNGNENWIWVEEEKKQL